MERYETWVLTKNQKLLNIEHKGWNEHENQFFYFRIEVKSLHSVASQCHFKEFDELAKDLFLLLNIIIQMLLFTVYIFYLALHVSIYFVFIRWIVVQCFTDLKH